MQNITNNPNTHYLDYYSDWLVAFKNSSSYYDLMKTKPLAIRCTDIMQEWCDAGKMNEALAYQYAVEMEQLLLTKSQTFLN